jgi:hypothetical protein
MRGSFTVHSTDESLVSGDRAMTSPWKVESLWPVVAATTVGAVGLIAGYLGSSSTVVFSRQLAWTAAAIGMAAVAGVGNALWLANGARAIRTRKQALVACFDGWIGDPAIERRQRRPGMVRPAAGYSTASGRQGMGQSNKPHRKSPRRGSTLETLLAKDLPIFLADRDGEEGGE